MLLSFCFLLVLGLQNTRPAMPSVIKPQAGHLATIIQSRSTNSSGYTVLIGRDGSATAEISGAAPRTQSFPPGTVDAQALDHLLQQVGDVSAIPIGFCAKSVSFGTRTEIIYDGKTSGDLQCTRRDGAGSPSQQAAGQLSDFVMDVLGKLRINAHRVITMPSKPTH
jgi:hypothetical protein